MVQADISSSLREEEWIYEKKNESNQDEMKNETNSTGRNLARSLPSLVACSWSYSNAF